MDNEQVEDRHLNKLALLKKCPNCGKRFEVEHMKESVERNEELLPEHRVSIPDTMVAGATPVSVTDSPMSQREAVQRDILLEEDDYTETYKCKHCGYVWTETFEKTKDVGAASGLRPDL